MIHKAKEGGLLGGLRAGGIPQAVKAAFLCSFAAGYIVHLFAFTNIIPNADGLSRVFDQQQMTVSGRWFLHYASVFNGFLQAPALIGFFSVLFLSLSAALVVSLLRIRSSFLGGLSGVLMVAFPAVAFTFLFLFTASAYSFGILLAVTAVWLTARDRRLIPLAVVLLACAIGTYQAYLAVAASLSLIAVLLLALEKESEVRTILLTGVRHLAFLLLGLLLYYAVLRLFLWAKDLTLLDYKGIDETGGSGMLRQAVALVIPAYRSFLSYFLRPGGAASFTTRFAVCVNAAFALLGVTALVCAALRGGLTKRPGKLALLIALCAILPLALNLSALMGSVREVMRYSLVFAYILALALTDRAAAAPADEAESEAPRRLKTLCRPLLAAALCLSLLSAVFSFYVDNLAYTASATAHRATESFATRLVERVEATPGYRNGMEVIIIGSFPGEIYGGGVEVFRTVDAPADSVLTLNKHVYYYLNDWLNVPWPEPTQETLRAVSETELFRAMPLYPDDGCIVIDGERVIVKLADHFTPKRDYEIQYENRR